MNTFTTGVLLASASFLAFTSAASAQSAGFTYELELETGINSVVKSDVAGNEITDTYGSANLGLEFAVSDSVTFFSALTLESVTGATANRTFGDLGLYVGEIGLSFALGDNTISAGKISPAFGIAWDVAPGYYGAEMTGDYELGEMIGVTGEFALGAGTVSAAAFFMDTSKLSDSLGTSRGQNTTAAGGAGNTGKLNNFALAYTLEQGATTLDFGLRKLSAGTGDVKDETGASFGIVHGLSDNVELIAELATFKGFGGTADDARYATVGASYSNGPATYSASYTQRYMTSVGNDNILSAGVDYELNNGASVSAGLGFIDDGGVKSTMVAVAFVYPLGG